MKLRNLRNAYLLLSIFFGLVAFFLAPQQAFAQNADCDSRNTRLDVPVYIYDQRGTVRYGTTANGCITGGANITRISGIRDTYFSCAAVADEPRVSQAFVAVSYQCTTGTMTFDVTPPPGFTCANSTWKYLGITGGFGSLNNTEYASGSGCRVSVPYPPAEWDRQIIVTVNLFDPPQIGYTCNNNNTVTLRWNGVAGATEYAWRLNNRANTWYTSTTDLYGYTAATTAIVPITYGASYDWAVTSTNSAGRHPLPSSWSAAFSCPAPTSTPVPPTATTKPAPPTNTPIPGCTDTDGGNNPDVAGNINSNIDGVAFDFCTNNSLTEYYCSATSRRASAVYACPYKCTNRACVPPPPPASCGTVSNVTSPARITFQLWLNGISKNTTFCDLYIPSNGPRVGIGTLNGTFPDNYCILSATAPVGYFTYSARVQSATGATECSTGTICGDRTAPPSPGPAAPPISCIYSGVDINGVNTYDVTYSINAVTDIGCAGMGTGSDTPYWIQLSDSNSHNAALSFTTAINSLDNTWQGGAAGLTSTITDIREGTTVYAHARARDDADNRSAWSGDSSRLLNAGNCPGVPTVTPTPTNTPIPTPAYWFKLKDSSLNKIFTSTDLTERVPLSALAFDGDDTTAGQMIIGQAGVATANFAGAINGGGILSANGWYNPSYSLNNPYLQDSTSLNYFKNTLITSKDIKTMSANDISQADANKVNIRESGDLTISNTAVLPNGPSVIFVDGDITLSISGAAPYRFNQANRSIALIATGTIYIDRSYTEATGIFIAPQVVLTSPGLNSPSQPALKINGNIISTNRVDTAIRQSNNQNRPSFFVVFKPKMYLDLLPLLSTVVQEGRQLE